MAGNHRSGRRPMSETMRVLKGGKTGAAQLQIKRGMPPPPEDLHDDVVALRYYKRIGGYLHAHGLMAHEYADALATLANVSADYYRTREQYKQLGFKSFHTEKRGASSVVVETPLLRRLLVLSALRMRLLGEFGLTPVMATKIFNATTDGASKWDNVIGGR